MKENKMMIEEAAQLLRSVDKWGCEETRYLFGANAAVSIRPAVTDEGASVLVSIAQRGEVFAKELANQCLSMQPAGGIPGVSVRYAKTNRLGQAKFEKLDKRATYTFKLCASPPMIQAKTSGFASWLEQLLTRVALPPVAAFDLVKTGFAEDKDASVDNHDGSVKWALQQDDVGENRLKLIVSVSDDHVQRLRRSDAEGDGNVGRRKPCLIGPMEWSIVGAPGDARARREQIILPLGWSQVSQVYRGDVVLDVPPGTQPSSVILRLPERILDASEIERLMSDREQAACRRILNYSKEHLATHHTRKAWDDIFTLE